MDESELISQAELQKSNYNWEAAVGIYEKIVEYYLKNGDEVKATEIYRELAYLYSLCAHSAKNSQDFIRFNEMRIKTYDNSIKIFKKLNLTPNYLECEAEMLYTQGLIAPSFEKARDTFALSYEVFLKSNKLYQDENNKNGVVRTICNTTKPLSYMIMYSTTPSEIEKIINETFKVQSITDSFMYDNTKYYREAVEAYISATHINLANVFIAPFTQGIWIEKAKNNFDLMKFALEYFENCKDKRLMGIIQSLFGISNLYFGFHYSADKQEQNEYMNRGLRYAEQGEKLLREVNDKPNLLYNLVWTLHHLLLYRQFDYVQKRIVKVVNEVLDLLKIFEDVQSFYNFVGYILPANYYVNNAQRSFFKPKQRISFAHKGIEYTEKCLKALPIGPYSSWSYQLLTWTYSLLMELEEDDTKKDQYSKLMLENANTILEICKPFKGGHVKAAAYSSAYRANKTLADISKDELTKKKYLEAAIDAQKNYIPHAIESQTGIISAQLRLGLLMEDLAKISKDDQIFKASLEIFEEVVKNSNEKGYLSYSGAAHEYIARIEDRRGNFLQAASNYEEARSDYESTLNLITYKLLKSNLLDKIEYLGSWILIEKAKSFHKKETHEQAQELYLKASEILGNIKQFKYESPYYKAWSFIESAEGLSKLEKHEEAIDFYGKAISEFENSISTLQGLTKIEGSIEKQRINKLREIAKLRVDYCQARIDLENARILDAKGDNLSAADTFASAGNAFNLLCKAFKDEKEKMELEAVFYLCRAWENMTLAKEYYNPEKYSKASELFKNAGELYKESKLKLLALGNSNICSALEKSCNFDQSHDISIKGRLYSQIKSMLKSATDSYRKGGFNKAADWAFATSSYFDATWNLIQAEMQTNFNEKRRLFNLGSKLLSSTAELFGKAGYKSKEKEVLAQLNMISKEVKIIISALNTISEPDITKSTTGIMAPACPLEISSSPKLGEARQLSETIEDSRFESGSKKKYRMMYKDLLIEKPEVQKNIIRVGIAQIGLSSMGDIIIELYDLKETGLMGIKKNQLENSFSIVEKFIADADDMGINILIFPEMMIDLNYHEIQERLLTLSKKYNMYIVPGSFHDESTKQNISRVISPEGIKWQQNKHIPATIHFGNEKFTEAITINTPPKETVVCNTEYGRIAIAICRDFLDMDLRVEFKNHEPPIDIIINPAFTPVTADFKAAHFDARRSVYAYCFFANVAEFGDSLIYTPEKERIERSLPAKEEGIIYKDIDLFKLRTERSKWEKEQLKERRFIQSTRL